MSSPSNVRTLKNPFWHFSILSWYTILKLSWQGFFLRLPAALLLFHCHVMSQNRVISIRDGADSLLGFVLKLCQLSALLDPPLHLHVGGDSSDVRASRNSSRALRVGKHTFPTHTRFCNFSTHYFSLSIPLTLRRWKQLPMIMSNTMVLFNVDGPKRQLWLKRPGCCVVFCLMSTEPRYNIARFVPFRFVL